MNVGNLWKTAAAAAALTVAAATPAWAVLPGIECSTMTGGSVSVTECMDLRKGASWYDVSNGSSEAITGFAVSTQSFPGEVFADRQGWYAAYLTRAQWNGEFDNTFTQYFGNTDTGVFLYYTGGMTPNPIAAGETTMGEFFFFAPLASEFVAFGSAGLGGTPLAGSLLGGPSVSAVPEPGVYALALCGLGVLGAVARSRRRSDDALA